MPIKTTPENAHDLRWNFFVNEFDKLEYLKALVQSGKSRCQSAGLRALMYLYINDKDTRDKTNAIIDDFLVYKQDGSESKL